MGIPVVDEENDRRKSLLFERSIVSRGQPSSFIYIVLAAGQDPGRTEKFLFRVMAAVCKLANAFSMARWRGRQRGAEVWLVCCEIFFINNIQVMPVMSIYVINK